eukprot:25624_1
MPKGFTSSTASACADTRWRRQQEQQKDIEDSCSKARHGKHLYSLKYDALISQFDSKQLHRNLVRQNYPWPTAQNITNIGMNKTKHIQHRQEEDQSYTALETNICLQDEKRNTHKQKESNFVDKQAFIEARKKKNRNKFKSKRGFYMARHCKKKK